MNFFFNRSKNNNDGALFHNRHLGIRIIFLLHLLFWLFFGITIVLNNHSLKDMKDSKYYYLIRINKIIMIGLICLTIVVCIYWSLIYKNFEFYCEAFQRQLKEANEANLIAQAQENQNNISVNINVTNNQNENE